MDKDTDPVTNQEAASDDIVVYDSFYQETFSRNLFLAPIYRSFWQTRVAYLVLFALQIRESDVAVATNNSELPQLNLDSFKVTLSIRFEFTFTFLFFIV